MRSANDLSELNLPVKQNGFLRVFITKLASIKNVERVILFGSCAKGTIHEKSDIDLFVITKKEPTIDEEIYIMSECPPDYENEYYMQSDIIIRPNEQYEKYKNEIGMVQKYVELDGVDLTGLLQKRSGQ